MFQTALGPSSGGMALLDDQSVKAISMEAQAVCNLYTCGDAGPYRTMRFGSTAKVLLKCKLKYYRISECVPPSHGLGWRSALNVAAGLMQALLENQLVKVASLQDSALHDLHHDGDADLSSPIPLMVHDGAGCAKAL